MWTTDTALLRLLVAAAIGALIGMERERAEMQSSTPQFAGVRTFPLFSLLGAVLVLASREIGLTVVVGFVAVAAIVIISYVRSSEVDIGSTTETAALATYWLGVLAGAGELLLAAALGIGIAILLASKQRIEAFTRALTPEEVRSALLFALIAAVVLPILPDARYGPWGVWNPRLLWGMVVIVSGLSFIAFVGMRLWGATRGLYVSGILGGLVSSTAVTVSFAARSREHPAYALPLAAGAGMASLVMPIRVAVLAAIAGRAVLPVLGPFLAVVMAVTGVMVVLVGRRSRAASDHATGVTNPFRLDQAIRFALAFGLVLLVVEAALRYLGAWGIVVAAVLAGVTNVDAITLALAGAVGTDLSPEKAAMAIASAVLSNTVAKAGFAAWMGSPRFRRATLAILGVVFAVGLLALLVLTRG